MNAFQRHPGRRGSRVTYRPVGDQPLISQLVTIMVSMLIGILLLGIVEVIAINL